MDELLKAFLTQGEAALAEAPFDFFGEPAGDERSALEGQHIVWFLAWAARRGLLRSGLAETLSPLMEAASLTAAQLPMWARALGGSLRPEHFNDEGRAFCASYYRPGGEHQYWADLEHLFPDAASFAEVQPTTEQLAQLSALLDSRRGLRPSRRQ